MTTAFFEYGTPAAFESAAFFESVAEAARERRRHPALGRLAMAAANAALVEAGSRGEGELEILPEASWEASPASFHQSFLANEAAAGPLMEHLGHAAAEAESNGEAFAFLAPLVPLALRALPTLMKAGSSLAAKVLPKAAATIARSAPKMIKGVEGVAKTLRSSPTTKPLVQAIPRLVQQTTADLAKRVANGLPVDSKVAVQMLARETAKLLGNPAAVVQTFQQAKSVDRRFHDAVSSIPAPAACCCGCNR